MTSTIEASQSRLFQAIDYVSVACLEAQRLRQLTGEQPHLVASAERLEATLRELGQLLVQIRDTPQLSD